MPTGYTFRKPYLQKSKNKTTKKAAFILTVIASVVGVFVIVNRLPQKSEPTNVINAPQTDLTTTNKNIKLPTDTNDDGINTNIITEPVTEVTNAATNTVATFTGTPPEITKGDTTKKQVVFTFDAGSGTQSAQQILDTLKKYHLTATFFMTGKWMEKNEELVKKVSDAGYEIHNHTYSHPHLTQITDQEIIDELKKTEEIFKNLTGKSTKPYFRAPYGERNAHVLEIAAQQGYQSAYWTVDALDWQESEGMTAERVTARIMSKLAPGVIYLMHVGDTLTGQILENVIKQIKNKEYDIVPLSQSL